MDDDKHRLNMENSIKEEDCFGDLPLQLATIDDDFDDKNKQETIDDLSVLSTDDEASLSSHTNHNNKEAGMKATKRHKGEKKPDCSEEIKVSNIILYLVNFLFCESPVGSELCSYVINLIGKYI